MEILDSFGLNWHLFLFQLANFAIVAVILWFLILKPLSGKLTERQKLIDDSLDNAKKIQDGLAKSEADYKTRMQEARLEAEKLLEAATGEAGKLSEELKAKAKRDIETLVKQAKHNIQAEKGEMMAAFKTEAAHLVGLALEKLINEKMTAEKDKKLIADVVAKLNK
ncbi:MAG: hypothetical protein AAB880_00375 [Patescibacteria group bacterium]